MFRNAKVALFQNWTRFLWLIGAAVAIFAAAATFERKNERTAHDPPSSNAAIVDGVTFAVLREQIFVPADEAARHLGWRVRHDAKSEKWEINGSDLRASSLRRLPDGTLLLSLEDLQSAGAEVKLAENQRPIRVTSRKRAFGIAIRQKRVEVNLATQRLRAFQGNRLILETRISSGRGRSTPTGSFSAGPYKARRHYSSRYDNAPMPWSIQVTGHIFIHGFSSVPNYPASHGCIRVPLAGANPAKFLYEWIDIGTPVRILRDS